MRLAGDPPGGTVAALNVDEDCALRQQRLVNFAPGTGTYVVEFTDAADNKNKQMGPTHSFSVRALYRGAVSFGPLASWILDPVYDVAPGENEGEFVLTESSGDLDLHYAVALTYYFAGARTRDAGFSLGSFVAVPITGALGDNAMAGFTVDFGTIFQIQGGLRLGRVNRLTDPFAGRYAEALGSGVPLVVDENLNVTEQTQSVFKPAPLLGVTIDAAAATRVFGTVLKSFAGDGDG